MSPWLLCSEGLYLFLEARKKTQPRRGKLVHSLNSSLPTFDAVAPWPWGQIKLPHPSSSSCRKYGFSEIYKILSPTKSHETLSFFLLLLSYIYPLTDWYSLQHLDNHSCPCALPKPIQTIQAKRQKSSLQLFVFSFKQFRATAFMTWFIYKI